MLHRLFKETPRVLDRLRVVTGGGEAPGPTRGLSMPDGSAVPVEVVMETHGVPRARAEQIIRMRSARSRR